MKKIPLYLIVNVILIVGFLFFDYRYSIGILLGSISAYLHFQRMIQHYTNVLGEKKYSMGSHIFYYIINMVILAVPVVLGAFFDNYVSVWGVFIALFVNHICLYIENWNRKE